MSTLVSPTAQAAPPIATIGKRAKPGRPIVAIDVHPAPSLTRRTPNGRLGQLVLCLAASVIVHGAALVALGYVRPSVHWNWLAVESGRASIDLAAAVAATPSHGEPELQMLPAPTPHETPPPTAPQASPAQVQRQADAMEPPVQRLPSKAHEPILLAQVDVADTIEELDPPAPATPPHSAADHTPQPTPQMRRANVGLRYATELTDQLAESMPSPPSQASHGADSEAPQIVANPAPQYPAEALASRLSGKVIVRAVLDPDGAVVNASVHRSSGSPLLDKAAIAAVRNWQFSPSQPGRSGPRHLAVPINFVLREHATP